MVLHLRLDRFLNKENRKAANTLAPFSPTIRMFGLVVLDNANRILGEKGRG